MTIILNPACNSCGCLSDIYVAGGFSAIGPAVRSSIARVDAIFGIADYFAPDPNNTVVTDCVVYNGVTYMVGDFTTINGVTRNHAAAVDSFGNLTLWDPNVGSQVDCMAIDTAAQVMYLGGTFATVGGVARANLACVDLVTGALTSWNPGSNDFIYMLCVHRGNVYAVGTFTTAGGSTRHGAAAFDSTGALLAWNPNLAGSSATGYSVIGRDGIIYVMGNFDTVGGTTRHGAAAFTEAGVLQSWNPDFGAGGSGGEDVVILNAIMYMVGGIAVVGGLARRNACAVDLISGAVQSWNPNLNQHGRAIDAVGQTVYVGGDFGFVGPGLNFERNHLAAYSTDGTLLDWDPNQNGSFFGFSISRIVASAAPIPQ